MTEGQLVTSRARAATAPWRSVVDACARAAGPFDPSLVAAWRSEMDDVQARLAALRGDVPIAAGVADPLPEGVHALLTLAGARLGTVWRCDQLVDAAAAAELAHRAVLRHDAVLDQPPLPAHTAGGALPLNTEHVLGGDWSITQAARLVADIGPSAYRVLVRGWGAAQLTRLRTGASSERDVLFATAVSLGALTAGLPADIALASRGDRDLPDQVLHWAARI